MRSLFLSLAFVVGCDGCDESQTPLGGSGGDGGGVVGGASAGSPPVGGEGGTGPIEEPCEGFDRTSDPLHCGAACAPCGVGTCVDGECQTAETVVANVATPANIATDGVSLFFASGGHVADLYMDGQLLKVPVAGGTPMVLAGEFPGVEAVALEGDNVVFSSTGTQAGDALDGFVARVAKSGGTVDTFAAAQPWSLQIAVDGSDYFWTSAGTFSESFSDGLIGLSANGGAPSAIVTPDAYPVALALDDTHVYWTSGGPTNGDPASGAVRRVPRAGGAPETIDSGLERVAAIAVVNGNLYYAVKDKIMTAPVNALDQITEFAATADGAAVFATDGQDLYWTESGGAGRVARQALAGGPRIVLAENLYVPYGIALDSTHCYFTVRGTGADDGAVMSIPK